jgi:hypothetical protein
MIAKTPQLRSVVLELRSKRPGIEVRDYWEAGTCQIGLIPASKPADADLRIMLAQATGAG